MTAFWDYGLPDLAKRSDGDVGEYLHIVVVDGDGAGVVPCATEAGNQLRHLGCPLSGPCAADEPRVYHEVRP